MNKNTFLYGAIIALIMPVIGFLIWLLINFSLVAADVMKINGEVFQFSEQTRVIVSICMNLIPFHIAQNKRWDNMLRGVGLVTFALLFGWAFRYGVLNF